MKFVMMHVRDNPTAHLGVLLEDGSAVDVTAADSAPEFASLMALIEVNASLASSPSPQPSPATGEGVKNRTSELLPPLPSGERVGVRATLASGIQQEIDNIIRKATPLPTCDFRLAAPIPRPTQYRDSMCFFQHIEQCATAQRPATATEPYVLPEVYRRQPVYYIGNRMNVSAPEQDIVWPRYSKVMDFELELACVIGKQAKNLNPGNALDCVFGFTIFNDFSARDAQGREMEGRLGPAKGKHFDGANVFGPCVVTMDEIGDPQNLRMQARVNGETWCDNSSSTMNWTIAQLLTHISADETIYPGEIIASGTVGNGCGLERMRFLKDGDVVELEIEKIGVLRNRVMTQM